MRSSSFRIEDIEINCTSMASATENIVSDVVDGRAFSVFTLNLDHVVKIRRDSKFRAAYKGARYVTPDGFPIVWAARLRGERAEQVTGADLIEPLCAAAAQAKLPVFLFGSTFQSLAGAARHLSSRHPGLEIAGIAAPQLGFDPMSQSAVDYARLISGSGARICFVALGAPKQEVFAAAALAEAREGVAYVCIGAGLDFLTGVQVRAPMWMQAVRTEWLWRLLCNPRRFWRRYLSCFLVLPSILLVSLKGRATSARASSS